MNKWECGNDDCDLTCVGAGGAVGLRAIGWYFKPGPVIFCPRHRPDTIQGDCSDCESELWAWHFQRLIDPAQTHLPVLALDHARHLAMTATTEPPASP